MESWQTCEDVENEEQVKEIFITASSMTDKTFHDAKMQELESWKAHEVVQEVLKCGQDLISTRCY